ncbi:amino acid permease [Parvibacter caecicola]|uniref:amino acid permease n=1 Tax=Parvibacter caecicola TaxID=747645 RepID=UPI003F73ADD3
MIPFESCSFSARKEGRAIMGASHDMSATTAAAPAASAAGTPAKAPGSPLKTLGFFGFFAITASMVMTVYAYPNFASSGMHLIFFLVLGGVFWFLPVALCAAEMATVKGWESGGIFAWVGNTLGKRWGFAALFYQWFQITVGFVTMAFFVLAALSYIVGWDALYNNPLVMFIGVAIIVWGLTLTQLGGTKLTARIAKIGFFGGVLVPAIVLMVGLVAYLATGGVSQLQLSAGSIVPDFTQVGTLVIFASFILAFAGVEASASHVNELKNPGRTYPLVMIVLCVLTILLDTLGGMAVAMTIPLSQLEGNMSVGVISSFAAMFDTHLHMGWLVYVIAFLLAAGVLAEISSWIVGPSRALLDTAKEGILPASFAKTNKHGVSVKTVVIQGIIVTIWDAVLCGSMALSGGSSSSVSYLTAVGLTVVIYLVGYVLFFLGYFKLVLKHGDLPRVFNVFGGKVGKLIVAGCGLALTLFALVVSFFPSSELTPQANTVYVITLLICWAVSVAIPFVIYGLRHHWDGSKKPSSPKAASRGGKSRAPHAV